MPQYSPYANKKDTPSRKNRKGARLKTFVDNKKLARKLRSERASLRREQAEAKQDEIQ